MAVIALCSAKGSPGVTTTALACTLSWHTRAILAECDPAGGSVLAGYLRGQLDGHRGLVPLAVAELRADALEAEFFGQLVDLDAPHRRALLLPGLLDPAQIGTVAPLWERFAGFFADLAHQEPGFDVIVDCGRLAVAQPPWPLLHAADTVLLVARPTLASAAAAVPAVDALRRQLGERGAGRLGLLLVGAGAYPGAEVASRLGLALAAQLPDDPRAAAVLGHGGQVRLRAPLLRAAAAAETPIRALAAAHPGARVPQPAGKQVRDGV